MSYTSSQRRLYVGVFFVLTVLIGLHYVGWLAPVEIFFYRLISLPASGAHSFSVKVGEEYQYFSNKNSFLESYATCTRELQSKQSLESQNKVLLDENTELKKQLNYIKKQKFPSVLADVIGNEIAGAEKAIIINNGSEQGIKIGYPVISGEGMLIGKVVRVEKKVAMVRLLNDIGSKIEAGIINTDKTIGIIEGGYGISLRMKFVPRSEVVKVDDQIITSGYEALVPRGLLVGKVVEVENRSNQGFQDIVVMPLLDLNKLTKVSVLLTE